MKFRYIVIGKQGWRQEHRWMFHDSAGAMAFAQTLLATHWTENEQDDPYEVVIEVYMEDDDEGTN